MDGGSIRAGYELPSAEIQRTGLFDILEGNRSCRAFEWFICACTLRPNSSHRINADILID